MYPKICVAFIRGVHEARPPLPAAHPPVLCCSLLRLLGSRWGSLLVLGFQGTYWGLPTAFVDLPRERREAVLRQWATSPQEKMRKVGDGVTGRSGEVLEEGGLRQP